MAIKCHIIMLVCRFLHKPVSLKYIFILDPTCQEFLDDHEQVCCKLAKIMIFLFDVILVTGYYNEPKC